MGDRAVIMGVVNVKAPVAVLPQGVIPFGVVRLFITALETIWEGCALVLVAFVFWYSLQLKAIFTLNVTLLILGWPLSCKNMWEEGRGRG